MDSSVFMEDEDDMMVVLMSDRFGTYEKSCIVSSLRSKYKVERKTLSKKVNMRIAHSELCFP